MDKLKLFFLAADPNPINVNPTEPPGADQMKTVLNWICWTVSFCAIVALLFFGIYLMLVRRRGMSVDSVGYFWQIVIGGGVAALAPAIVAALIHWS